MVWVRTHIKRRLTGIHSMFQMKGRSDTCKQQVKEMVREARVMRDLSHPNIVHFYGVCLQEQPIYILLELIQGQPLDVYLLENKSTIDKDEKLQIIMGIAWGLEYLHSMSVLHRDISAKNCHYDTSKVVRLSEFSLSRQGTTYAMKTARKMPIKWLAPESIRTFMFTQKSDVYNYGVFIYEVFACIEPYAKLSTNAAKDAILGGTLNDFPEGTPEKLAHYVKDKMWQTDPDKREDMAHIKPWLEIFTGLTLVVERKK
ncbi:protein tyrosine kinase [Cooperia oncophora]